jgi:hypothetical protein
MGTGIAFPDAKSALGKLPPDLPPKFSENIGATVTKALKNQQQRPMGYDGKLSD